MSDIPSKFRIVTIGVFIADIRAYYIHPYPVPVDTSYRHHTASACLPSSQSTVSTFTQIPNVNILSSHTTSGFKSMCRSHLTSSHVRHNIRYCREFRCPTSGCPPRVQDVMFVRCLVETDLPVQK